MMLQRVPGSFVARNVLAAGAAVLLGVGCASTRLDAQWSDPALAPTYLRGARVFIACEARDAVVQRTCQERVAEEVTARGGTPVLGLDPRAAAGKPAEAGYLASARKANAKALLSTRIVIADRALGPGFSIGIGGFGGSGNVGIGGGMSVPVGGGELRTGYAADTELIDAATGRTLWTAKATAKPSTNLEEQLGDLAKTVLAAADRAGLF